jgi:hypothetical protein
MKWFFFIMEELPYEELGAAQERSAWAILGVAAAIGCVIMIASAGRFIARMRLRPCPRCREFIDRGEKTCPRCGAGLIEGWAEKT